MLAEGVTAARRVYALENADARPVLAGSLAVDAVSGVLVFAVVLVVAAVFWVVAAGSVA